MRFGFISVVIPVPGWRLVTRRGRELSIWSVTSVNAQCLTWRLLLFDWMDRSKKSLRQRLRDWSLFERCNFAISYYDNIAWWIVLILICACVYSLRVWVWFLFDE
jgi:hypothetical protein